MSTQSKDRMKLLEITFWTVGLALLALYTAALAWGDWTRERGISAYIETQQSEAAQRLTQYPHEENEAAAAMAVSVPPRSDAVIAVLRAPGIHLEVPVGQGTDETVLRRGAGLIVGSATPGSQGNVAIAAHRDTFFRGLKDITVGDLVELDTLDRLRIYRVTELSVVEPTDVHVLADTGEPVLTLVTCYPFYFVGHAPQRFIVRAVAADVAT
jgi:sortase A